MKASFELSGLHRPVSVLTPETNDERLLLAAWIGYDENVISADVERFENGHIKTMTLSASESR